MSSPEPLKEDVILPSHCGQRESIPWPRAHSQQVAACSQEVQLCWYPLNSLRPFVDTGRSKDGHQWMYHPELFCCLLCYEDNWNWFDLKEPSESKEGFCQKYHFRLKYLPNKQIFLTVSYFYCLSWFYSQVPYTKLYHEKPIPSLPRTDSASLLTELLRKNSDQTIWNSIK